jgi:hypothetical protein
VAQVVGPEFKPQYCKKTKKQNKTKQKNQHRKKVIEIPISINDLDGAGGLEGKPSWM